MVITSSSIIKKLMVLFLVIAGLFYAREFLIPLSIGAVLATFFLPFCIWMEKKKVPRGLAAFLCLLTLLLVIAGAGIILGWQISELITDIELIKQKVITTISQVQEFIYNKSGISAAKQSQFLKDDQSSVTGIIQKLAGSLIYIITDFILVMFYIFGLLYFRSHIKHFFLKLFPPSQRNEMGAVVNKAAVISQQYLLGLGKMIIILWIMYGIAFSLLGIKNAIFYAVICGLLEIIPFVGNITGTTITILAAGANGAGYPVLGGIAVSYIVVQLIQGWVLEPLILGHQVKINPFFTIIALVLGEIVWGIPGIFLAIPIAAMFKIVCDHIDSLKPYGFLIGEIGPIKDEPVFIKKIKSWFINITAKIRAHQKSAK